MSKLSPAMEKALAILTADGVIYMGNGVTLATVRALETRGLATVDGTVRSETNSRSNRTHAVRDWTAWPTRRALDNARAERVAENDAQAPVQATEDTTPAPATETPDQAATEETGDDWKGFKVNAEQLAATRAKIDAINARAERKDLVGRLELIAEKVIETETDESGIEIEHVYYLARIDGVSPAQPDWRFVATLDWDPNAGLIVRTVPGVESVDRTGLEDSRCAQCNTVRDRRQSYLLLNTKTGEYRQVGSSCIKDFIGWSAGISWLDPIRQSEMFGGGDIFARDYTPLTVIAFAWAAIQTFGWVPKSSYKGHPTAYVVSDVLYPPTKGEAARRARELANQLRPFADQAKARAQEVIDFISSEEFAGDSEYVWNLKSLVRAEFVSPRYLGLIVSAPAAWDRHRARELVRQARTEAGKTSVFVGNVKERLTLKVKVMSIRHYDGDYGTRSLVMFRDENTGNLFKWWASSALGTDLEGEVHEIKGTVKAHEEYQGVKNTVLTRVAWL